MLMNSLEDLNGSALLFGLAELMNNKTAAATWSAPAGSHVAAASECSRRAELTQ